MDNNDVLDLEEKPKPPGIKTSDIFMRVSFGLVLLGVFFKVQHWPYAQLLLSTGFGFYSGFLFKKLAFYQGPNFRSELIYFAPFSLIGAALVLLWSPMIYFGLFLAIAVLAFILTFVRDRFAGNPSR